MSDNKKSLFISDLHLDSDNSVITASFLNFLSTRAVGCESLYILGDLFEVWVGDDDHNHLTDTVANALSALSAAGSRVYLMHGNRDFLLGSDYAARCGATLLEEPAIIDCHGQRVLLIHGDSLCTRDTDYMKFRKMVRSERWQNEFLDKSLVERHMIAQQARQQSKEHNSNKASDIMDVTHQEVLNLLHEKQVNTLVHGHTHRPAVHTIRLQDPINGHNEAVRIVLGSWDSKGWVLEFTEAGFDLKYFPLQG
ncbi:MAG: UDP-2,3-diacylglucosamine diphosphatase [Gammaproteobacteria bacterium]|nr:UDP-2,3-diacylglucosamine diphosphatase [Gammaproteobacteria bacterium]MDP2139256.1 UDP-2,3-diacylglucosamine diphosphatase [Gammaproteobacteria bacterium]MDP2348975.1 UDP-2,3-diacylglucosamine diphosphatase [Gammaproteobacteria bacterium]